MTRRNRRRLLWIIPIIIILSIILFFLLMKFIKPIFLSPNIYLETADGICIGQFIRGDANNDRQVDLSDTVTVLSYLYSGGSINCRDAADFSDNGKVELSDVINYYSYLYSGGAPPKSPFPEAGYDETCDKIDNDKDGKIDEGCNLKPIPFVFGVYSSSQTIIYNGIDNILTIGDSTLESDITYIKINLIKKIFGGSAVVFERELSLDSEINVIGIMQISIDPEEFVTLSTGEYNMIVTMKDSTNQVGEISVPIEIKSKSSKLFELIEIQDDIIQDAYMTTPLIGTTQPPTGGQCECSDMVILTANSPLQPFSQSVLYDRLGRDRNLGQVIGEFPFINSGASGEIFKNIKGMNYVGFSFQVLAVVDGNPDNCKECQLVQATVTQEERLIPNEYLDCRNPIKRSDIVYPYGNACDLAVGDYDSDKQSARFSAVGIAKYDSQNYCLDGAKRESLTYSFNPDTGKEELVPIKIHVTNEFGRSYIAWQDKPLFGLGEKRPKTVEKIGFIMIVENCKCELKISLTLDPKRPQEGKAELISNSCSIANSRIRLG